ncbi:hypothetical protein [Risungbinella massiliensis]|uniref:hypothetical protein n=1 Tax=Risungbinella massiliensis TaxID=1329796 RepID=UPI0005CBADA3|nr:hypothetical protein [Risungbinella massiliensis]
MQKNARGYSQDAQNALNQAKNNLQNALNTVEKQENKALIEQSLLSIASAMEHCDIAVNSLEQE